MTPNTRDNEKIAEIAREIHQGLRQMETLVLTLSAELRPASNPAEYYFYEMLLRIAQLTK